MQGVSLAVVHIWVVDVYLVDGLLVVFVILLGVSSHVASLFA